MGLRALVLAAAGLLGWLEGRRIPSWREDSWNELGSVFATVAGWIIEGRTGAILRYGLLSATFVMCWLAWPPLIDDSMLHDPFVLVPCILLQRWFLYPLGMFVAGLASCGAWYARRHWFRK